MACQRLPALLLLSHCSSLTPTPSVACSVLLRLVCLYSPSYLLPFCGSVSSSLVPFLTHISGQAHPPYTFKDLLYTSNSQIYLSVPGQFSSVPSKFMPCLWDHLVDICQLKLEVGSHPSPWVSSSSHFFSPSRQHHHLLVIQPVTWLSSLP